MTNAKKYIVRGTKTVNVFLMLLVIGRKQTSNNFDIGGGFMDFEKAKKLLKESIDEGKNLFEIMEIFTDKVYEQGKQDGKETDS